MSLPVWPSAFIRLAVATWVVSRTFLGRPNLVPLARDNARFRAVRSGEHANLVGLMRSLADEMEAQGNG
jgi:hypothetical protein